MPLDPPPLAGVGQVLWVPAKSGCFPFSFCPPLLSPRLRKTALLPTHLPHSNAIKFTHVGEIVVSVARECVAKKAGLRVGVTDMGIGVAPDNVASIFEPYRQADETISRAYRGTGLGLAIVKEFAEQMGGTAGCQSQLGSGSTFWFTLVAEPGPEGEAYAVDTETNTDDVEDPKEQCLEPWRVMVCRPLLSGQTTGGGGLGTEVGGWVGPKFRHFGPPGTPGGPGGDGCAFWGSWVCEGF